MSFMPPLLSSWTMELTVHQTKYPDINT